MNDIMEPLIKQNGAVNGTVEYLGKVDGKWLAVPATVGSQIKGPCSRIDLLKQHAGIDVQAMYPAGAPPKADAWTLDTFLKAAEACHKGGNAFGIGLGTTSDNVDTAGAIFHGFGAMLVDAKGDITVKSDAVRQALDYYKKLMAFLPADAPAWDDASNNKWLVSGQGALIMNPPSAWAVAKRDAPQGRRAVLDARLPGRPEGPLRAVPAVLLGHLELQQEPVGGQEPARRICRSASSVEKMVERQRRLRPAVVREPHDLQDLGRGGAAQGHALPLPEPAQPPDPVDRRGARAAQDRRADLHPGHPDPDGRPLLQGRGDGQDARLGGQRARRLHAQLARRRQFGGTPSRRRRPRRDRQRISRLQTPGASNGRHRRHQGSASATARQPQQPAQADAAQVDHRLPDGAAADPADRHPGGLSGGLCGLSGDAQQVR